MYWTEDQLANVSTWFYMLVNWRRRVRPSASWLNTIWKGSQTVKQWISNLNPATQPPTSSNLSQSQTYNQTTPSPNKAPPHCRQCHHPVRGHKRLNNAQVKCYFCENGTCTVSDDISSSNCPCSWHTANQHESNQSTCNNQSASLPTPDSQTTLRINVTIAQHLDVTEWLLPSYICQSSIGGRPSGSNTCTVIAVLAALDFLEGTLQIPMQLQARPQHYYTYVY